MGGRDPREAEQSHLKGEKNSRRVRADPSIGPRQFIPSQASKGGAATHAQGRRANHGVKRR